ncbi:MAG: hypothetical protein ACOX02_00440 [Acholeplasmatales bacterium]
MLYKVYSYNEINLENLNFNMKSNQDKETLRLVFTTIYKDIKKIIFPSVIIASIVSEILTYIILVLISVWSYSYFRPKLKMRYRFILASYGFSIYLVSSLLAELYNFSLLRIGGAIIGFIFIRQAYIHLVNQRGKQSEQV